MIKHQLSRRAFLGGIAASPFVLSALGGQARAAVFWGRSPALRARTRARAAVADMLATLAAVHASHDDPLWTIDDLALAVRRWIEEQTSIGETQPETLPWT